MPQAIWNDKTIAQSDVFETVEGNVYFPPGSLDESCFQPSETTTVCSWKGTANYYHVVVDGQVNKDAAWFYKNPKEAAANIKDHVAFWRGVKVEP